VASLVIIIPLLVFGWYRCRDRIYAVAAQREEQREAEEARAQLVTQETPHNS
jgi:L-asparagine permease